MNQYLFSVHSAAGSDCQSKPPEEMQEAFQRIEALEREMKSAGVWLSSGKLTEAESATVVREKSGEVLMTDGPFMESKEHLAGFYIIQVADLDAALAWARKVTAVIGEPIEVRSFWGFQSN